MIGIQQDSLGGGIDATCRCEGGIEGDGNVDVEFVLYLFCRIGLIVQYDDGERDLAVVFFYQRFEIGDIKAGTRAIGVKKVQKNRLISGGRQFSGQVDRGSRGDRMIFFWNGGGKTIFPVREPEDINDAAENGN